MASIESIIRACGAGETVIHLLDPSGERVRGGDAYRGPHTLSSQVGAGVVICVECEVEELARSPAWIRIDHHRPGDVGYGRPPAEFLAASSVGQVIAYLRAAGATLPWGDDPVPDTVLMTAAGDHCLGAAYAGQCPGVDPDALMVARVATRAAFQGRAAMEILADIEAARIILADAPMLTLLGVGDMPHTHDHDWSVSVCGGCAQKTIQVRDLRGAGRVPELVEAATRDGVAYVSAGLPDRDGRIKVVASGKAEVIKAFDDWAERQGLVDCYGDPMRGFAGAYITPSCSHLGEAQQ